MKERGARIIYWVCAGGRRAHRELVTLHGSGSATLQTESAAKGIRPMRLKMVADSACEATLHETFRLRLWRRLCSSALFPRKLSLSKTTQCSSLSGSERIDSLVAARETTGRASVVCLGAGSTSRADAEACELSAVLQSGVEWLSPREAAQSPSEPETLLGGTVKRFASPTTCRSALLAMYERVQEDRGRGAGRRAPAASCASARDAAGVLGHRQRGADAAVVILVAHVLGALGRGRVLAADRGADAVAFVTHALGVLGRGHVEVSDHDGGVCHRVVLIGPGGGRGADAVRLRRGSHAFRQHHGGRRP